MGLIKSPAPAGAAPYSMRDIEEQARAILFCAQQEADQMRAEAQAEGERLRAAAHAQGLAEGRAEGLAEGGEQGRAAGHQEALAEARGELADLISALSAAALELDESRHRLETEAIQDVVALSVAIARRVTKRQAAMDVGVLAENLAESMKLVVHAADVRIAVHPAQKQALAELLPQLQLQWPALDHVEITEDASLTAGGCRIITRGGQIDADIDGQLDRVIENLLPPARLPG
jgi:flagellar assembly protein FliH